VFWITVETKYQIVLNTENTIRKLKTKNA
jgi:hypothetical protein